MPSFKCKDIGMNCKFEVKNAASEQELMEQIKLHAKSAHNVQQITPDLEQKIKKAIKK